MGFVTNIVPINDNNNCIRYIKTSIFSKYRQESEYLFNGFDLKFKFNLHKCYVWGKDNTTAFGLKSGRDGKTGLFF